MTRNALFKSPFLLGFDRLEKLVERSARAAADSYPPYNIEASDDKLSIVMAVAGFSREELCVTVCDSQLVIQGRQGQTGERNFVHHGIAARSFERTFILADTIEVLRASLEHGMLRVELLRRKVETRTRNIEIQTNQRGAGSSQETFPEGEKS